MCIRYFEVVDGRKPFANRYFCDLNLASIPINFLVIAPR